MNMVNIIVCRTVFTVPTLISIPIPMATVPSLALISMLIRGNLNNFHCNFASELPSVSVLVQPLYIT